jgi:hypothetical protein
LSKIIKKVKILSNNNAESKMLKNLKKLEEMKQMGIITQEQYEERKKEFIK